MALGYIGTCQYNLCAHGFEIGNLFTAHLVRYHQDQLIALLRRYQGQAQARVACRTFHQCRTRSDQTGFFRVLDHSQADAVLDRPARVLALQLDVKTARTGVQVVDAHDRGVPDQIKN